LLEASPPNAQTVHQEIVPQNLVFERSEFPDIPIGAQIPALGPVRLAGAKPDGETGGQLDRLAAFVEKER
jgi:hypothetical protein